MPPTKGYKRGPDGQFYPPGADELVPPGLARERPAAARRVATPVRSRPVIVDDAWEEEEGEESEALTEDYADVDPFQNQRCPVAFQRLQSVGPPLGLFAPGFQVLLRNVTAANGPGWPGSLQWLDSPGLCVALPSAPFC